VSWCSGAAGVLRVVPSSANPTRQTTLAGLLKGMAEGMREGHTIGETYASRFRRRARCDG